MRSRKVWLSLVLLSLMSLVITAAPLNAPHGVNTANMDRTCAPCADFNKFANGGWEAKNSIPAAYPSWGVANEVNERNRNILHEILEDAAKSKTAAHGSSEQKVGDYYGSCMDVPAIDREGVRPLQPEFDRIERVADVAGLEAEIAHLQSMGIDAFFGVDSTQDFKDSTQVTGEVDQGGLGMPDRDYYTRQDEKSVKQREEYLKHVTKMFELLGDTPDTAAAEAQTVMDLETQLAKASQTKVERRDPKNVYHRMTQSGVKTLAPDFPWEDYFTAVGLAGKGDVNVTAPDFFKQMGNMISTEPISKWKIYLRWHLINSSARSLSTPFVDEDFHFKGTVLTGTEEILPRWKRCVSSTDHVLGEALGQVYVKKAFPPEAKTRALTMVRNLEAALADDIKTLPWMSDATRQQALIKLNAITNKIGYPDKWRDYSSLDIQRGSHVENVARAATFEFHRDLNKVGKPVDRTEWGMSPPTVNAYYNPQLNEIVFPAGILQPPFFDFQADDALNYGAMGAIIGHEMTHGFDDEGSQFDAQGNFKNWWTPDDQKNFQARGACVASQFDGFFVEDKLHENGKLVEGESIADLGGLAIAYAAYQKSMEGKPRPKDIDGFTPEQRFFIGYAQSWAEKMRPEYARMLTNVDPHPLPKFRVLGPLSNLAAFAKAFGCKAGDPMVRPANDRCGIW
ncbi:MAG: M13 family metallopeptidase [Acidobacteriota bacterium]|nr:M13 family metallopeptidase [Acidobacteriota bacterium]